MAKIDNHCNMADNMQKKKNFFQTLVGRPLLALLYFGICLALYLLLPDQVRTMGDSSGYLQPARAMAQGAPFFSSLRLPGYPALLALFDLLGAAAPLAVACNALCLWLTGLLAQNMADRLGRTAQGIPWVLLLTVFNPVALFFVQRVLPGTVFTLFIALHLHQLLACLRTGSVRAGALSGLAAGLAALLRANGGYLLLAAPLLALIALGLGRREQDRIWPLKGLAALVLLAGLALAPYVLYQHGASGQWGLTSPQYRAYALHDNLVILEERAQGIPREQAAEHLSNKVRALEDMDRAQWDGLGFDQRNLLTAEHTGEIMLGHGVLGLARGMAHSLAVYLLDGGMSQWLDAFGVKQIGALAAAKAFFALDWSGRGANILAYVLLTGFVLLVRLLDLAGAARALVERSPGQLLLLGYVLYFAFVAAFLGYARYRLPCEPVFMLLAVQGAGWLRRLPGPWRREKA